MTILSDDEIKSALSRVEACLGEERPRDAVADLQRVLAAVPNHPMALCGAGRVSIQLGDNHAALQALDLALALDPGLAEARNARGAALQNLGRLDEAETEFRHLVDSLPDHPGPLLNLAATLAAKGDLDPAEAMFARILELRPGDATAEYNLGLLRLLRGDLANGWKGFEFRDRASNVGLSGLQSEKPRWTGAADPSAVLLIHAEQGLGDNIQFARFVTSAAGRVGRVIWELPDPLTELFAGFPGVAAIVGRGRPLPDHDFHVPIMGLPAVLGADAEPLWRAPYVKAAPATVAKWRARLERRNPDTVHVGLVWAGNPAHKRDRERSVPFQALDPLFQVPGVTLHSLQIGAAADQAAQSASASSMGRLFRITHPFTDVAAAISALDLLISVDTSLVHLAGSLGRPVWTMITHVPDWRWMLGRQDTPWYPTMRLFRQPKAGDWTSVIAEVEEALQDFVPGRNLT
jgi:tetratricopeptide (TPR) repeat protein